MATTFEWVGTGKGRTGVQTIDGKTITHKAKMWEDLEAGRGAAKSDRFVRAVVAGRVDVPRTEYRGWKDQGDKGGEK